MKYNEIPHFSHPKHNLRFEYLELPFKCDGCKEVGMGSRYSCDCCDFDLHVHCALPIASLCHPFYPKCIFQFLSRPPGDKPRYCNACEKDVAGFVYHCHSCGFDLHPCCARLPATLDVDDSNCNSNSNNARLYLHRKVGAPCHRCGRKGRSWSYRSSCKKYNLHVACAREMLVESWHDVYMGRSSSSGNTMWIPSMKGTLQSYHHNHRHKSGSKGKVQKCCEIAGTALQFVISALLGDPTTLIAGVIGSIISRS